MAAASVAATAALALAAGLTTPAAAAPGPSAGRPADTGAVPAPVTRITLLTGDRVVLDADRRPVGLERAKAASAYRSPSDGRTAAPASCPTTPSG